MCDSEAQRDADIAAERRLAECYRICREQNVEFKMRDLSQAECDAIEAVIDGCGIDAMLMALSDICGKKAAHIAENWQDTALAKRWAVLEGAIGVIVPKATGL